MRRLLWMLALAACGKTAEAPPAPPAKPVAQVDAAAPDAKATELSEAAPARRLWAPKLDTEA